jgi:small GTP-binding protein
MENTAEVKGISFEEYILKMKREFDEFNNATVKCAMIGQSGSGKSTLINTIFGENICNTGTVETTLKKSGPFEKDGVSFFDLPGCGTVKFPKETYIEEMDLKSFDFIILVTANRFYENDLFLIQEMDKIKKPIYIVRTKIDQAINEGEFNHPKKSEYEVLSECLFDLEKYLTTVSHFGIYLISARQPSKFDLGKLLLNISKNLTNVKKQKFIAEIFISNEEILKAKREIAEKIVNWSSVLSGANGLNPIPGLDIAADLGVIISMNKKILKIFGLDEDSIKFLEKFGTLAGTVLSIKGFAAQFLSKELVVLSLKKYIPQIAGKQFAKFFPIVGQITSVIISAGLTKYLGTVTVNSCEIQAKEILNDLTK